MTQDIWKINLNVDSLSKSWDISPFSIKLIGNYPLDQQLSKKCSNKSDKVLKGLKNVANESICEHKFSKKALYGLLCQNCSIALLDNTVGVKSGPLCSKIHFDTTNFDY